MSNPNKKISKSLTPARQLALRTLLSMQARNEKLQAALNETLAAAGKTILPEDKALATELVYGCVRLKIRLDWILNQHFNKPEDVPSAMRRVMRMAAYELAYLSHIPSYATLNSYVDAIKAGYGLKLAGLANAVLRKISQIPSYDENWFKQHFLLLPPALGESDKQASNLCPNTKEFMHIWYSLPLWLLDHFLDNYPPDLAEQYMAASIATPPLGLRLNKLNENFLNLSQTLPQEAGFILQQDEALAFHSGFMPKNFGRMLAQGQMTRQSFAAQEVMQQIFNTLHNEISTALALGPIWDVCAGQGGKTCWMLEKKLPVAASFDTNLKRLHGLAREVTRLNLLPKKAVEEQTPTYASTNPVVSSPYANLAIIAADASKPLPIKGQPGIILLDAPCSGLGTLARRPDIKINREPANLPALADLQKKIINTSFARLPPGGLLIYLTCTLNPAENEEIIACLQQIHKSAQQIFTWSTPPNSVAKEFFWVSVLKKKN